MKAFFDTIDHALMMKAVEKHVKESWLRLYIRRWLEAPVQTEEGKIEGSTRAPYVSLVVQLAVLPETTLQGAG
jgi:retron-type reverse transcriptase